MTRVERKAKLIIVYLKTRLAEWGEISMKTGRKNLNVQINPHFFYNTLNGMLALNHMGEKKKLQKTIMNLADVCRYASVGEEDTASIEEDCMILEQYLELEKLKYDDRIEYEISVEDACKDRKIPKMLLLPILENSMVHGMGEREQVLALAVRVSAADVEGKTGTRISIRDNGIGFDTEVLESMEDGGIEYVKNRARLFDGEMTFQCTSKPQEGTETVIFFRGVRRGNDYFSS